MLNSTTTFTKLLPFWSYVISYLILVLLLVFVLWTNIDNGKTKWAAASTFTTLVQTPTSRHLLIAVFLAMAGLPPFNFFVFKVGILVYLINSASITTLCVILLLLLFSWYAYQAVIFRLLPSNNILTKGALNQTNISKVISIPMFLAFLVLSFFFVEDLFVFAAWISFV